MKEWDKMKYPFLNVPYDRPPLARRESDISLACRVSTWRRTLMFSSVAYIEIPGFESRSEHDKYLLFEIVLLAFVFRVDFHIRA